jgi:Domain of unknown function (DUF4351)
VQEKRRKIDKTLALESACIASHPLFNQPTPLSLFEFGIADGRVSISHSPPLKTLRQQNVFRNAKCKRDESRSQVQSLSLPQLESLSEVLLDFTSVDDLSAWLRSRSVSSGESH